MRYLIITLAAVASMMLIGCVSLEKIREAKCGENIIEFDDLTVEIPEMDDFELTLFDRPNNHLALTHKTDNVSIDLEMDSAEIVSFEEIKENLSGGKNKITKWWTGWKAEIYHERVELIGHERYIYFYKINENYNAVFTQYDYTGGKHDKKIAEIVEAILITPKKKGGD